MDDVIAVGDIDLGGPFTLDEVDLIERLSGVPLPRWFDGETPEGALRKAIVYVVARKTDPQATPEAAGSVLIRADREG